MEPSDDEDDDETIPLAPTATKSSSEINSAIVEVLELKNHIEFVELEKTDEEPIRWDQNSGRFLYISKTERPFLFLSGTIAKGYELSWDDRWVKLRNSRFEIKISLPLDPTVYALKVFRSDRSFRKYRYASYWTQLPDSLTGKVANKKAIPPVYPYQGMQESAAAAQLYSENQPVTEIDLDSQKQARLSVRLFQPLRPEEHYDSWRLTLRDSQNQIIGDVSRYGSPPPYIDWRELNKDLIEADTYTYRLDLVKDQNIFEGVPNQVRTYEGLSLVNHAYLPLLQVEPKEEIGYYSFNNKLGTSYSNIYVAADVPLIFGRRFIIRGTALLGIHSIDPNENYSMTRIGAGFRFYGKRRRRHFWPSIHVSSGSHDQPDRFHGLQQFPGPSVHPVFRHGRAARGALGLSLSDPVD